MTVAITHDGQTFVVTGTVQHDSDGYQEYRYFEVTSVVWGGKEVLQLIRDISDEYVEELATAVLDSMMAVA